MTGQAGMKVADWREAVRDGMKRYAAGGVGRLAPEENALAVGGHGALQRSRTGGSRPAGADAWRGVFAGREAPHIFPVSMLTKFGILDI